MKSRLAHFLSLAGIVVVTTVAYSNSFNCAFVFDDFANIINVKGIRLFQPSIQGIIEAALGGPNHNRWIPNLSFAINYYFDGENVWGYHLVNLIIHISNAIALYFLFMATLRLSPAKNEITCHREIAFLAALLWAVHPLQTNAVTYMVQRMTSMSTFFSLISLLSYVYARASQRTGAAKYFLFCVSFLAGLMAVASKENAIILPVLILGFELFFFQKTKQPDFFRKSLLCFAAALSTIVIITFTFLGKDVFSTILEGYNYRSFTLSERLLTQPRIILFYILLLFFPHPSQLNLNHDFSLSHSLLSPPSTALAILCLIILIACIFIFFNKSRLFSFALFWFLANLVIESSIVPLELIYEHRLYLPSIFLFLLFTSFVYNHLSSRIGLCRILSVVLILLSTFWTWERNKVWLNNETLWSDVIAKSPGLARGYNNLGVALHEDGNLKEAEKLFLQAIESDPESRVAYVSLGSLYVTQNRLQEAEKILRTALTKETRLNPSRILHYLGVLYRKTGNCEEAMQYANRSLHLEENDLEPMITVGICYEKFGEYDKADATFQNAFESGLDYNIDLYNNWGIVNNKLGKTDRAIELFKKALEINPDHPESHYNLGLAYSEKGLIDEARKEMMKSMELRQKM